MHSDIHLEAQPLRLPFKTTFRHASAARKTGESVWVSASLQGETGFGEGCPRSYVTGEDLDSCLAWVKEQIPSIRESCTSSDALRQWVNEHRASIDAHPSGWCAMESALLDVLARKQHISVEALLGLPAPTRSYAYTAVVGDDEEPKYLKILEMYTAFGFTDFKIKISGDLGRDRRKLALLEEMRDRQGISGMRVRLDANNLWQDDAQGAIDHLNALGPAFFAIEEPVAPRQPEALSAIGVALNTAVILDESLCTLEDLEAYDALPGRFIANIKVSRVGGVLRALDLIEALKARGWPIIVGAHVGETSVLTRAAMCVANAAGERLIAQEGGFGTRLLERDFVEPSLRFGQGGVLDLSAPYIEKMETGETSVPVENWSLGWGIKVRGLESGVRISNQRN